LPASLESGSPVSVLSGGGVVTLNREHCETGYLALAHKRDDAVGDALETVEQVLQADSENMEAKCLAGG
jgi:hypothetical protein